MVLLSKQIHGPLTRCVAWLSISCHAESNCRWSSSSSLCSARAMVSLAARSTSAALWKSCVDLCASSWAWRGKRQRICQRSVPGTTASSPSPFNIQQDGVGRFWSTPLRAGWRSWISSHCLSPSIKRIMSRSFRKSSSDTINSSSLYKAWAQCHS